MKDDVLQYEYASKVTYLLGLYREPLPILSTIMLPLFLINVIILSITWLGGSDAALLGSVTTILLVLVAYMPTIRAEIPSQPYFTLIDYILISLVLQCLIALSPIFLMDKTDVEGNWREKGILIASFPFFAAWVLFVLFKTIQYPARKRIHDTEKTGEVNVDSGIFDSKNCKTAGKVKKGLMKRLS